MTHQDTPNDGGSNDELAEAIERLSIATSLTEVTAIVRRAARQLTGADGVTFVLRDGDQCHYADESAIAPLWKGKRFPMTSCISGWVMTHRMQVVIPDVFVDSRIPHQAYRPTFVKSMAMVPVRDVDPLGAIGAYWASTHSANDHEMSILKVLADTSGIVLSRAS